MGQQVSSAGRWILGDLASQVETSYKEGRLQQYAADIDVSYNTLRAYRKVSEAWPQIDKTLFIIERRG